MGQLQKLFSSLSLRQRITILTVVLLVGGGLFALSSWKRESDFRPLYTSMSPEDAGAVIQKIKESGSEYRLAENGATVLVPSAKQAELRLMLAAAGLPKTGRIGFELFDKTNFGATEFVEHINYRRALEGELERSVMALSEIEQARVHITFPKDSVFMDARQPAKASVLVHLRPGARLAAPNVMAISHLVSSAVEGLAPEDVSVLDMRGNLLSRPRKPGLNDGSEPTEAMLDFRQQIERDLVAKINSTLEPLLGAEKYRAGASVECDFSSSEQSEESLDPSKSVMLSSQKTEDSSPGSVSAGVPGTASSLPRPTSRPVTALAGLSRRTENITYQSSRITRHTRLPQGTVKRISLAVLLDQGVRWEGQGARKQRVLVPPSPETVKSIRDLVAAATGLVPDRGDQLILESLPFEATLNQEPITQTPAPPPPARTPSLVEQLQRNRTWLIGSGIAAAGVLALMVFLIFARRKQKKTIIAAPPALPVPEQVAPAVHAERAVEGAAPQLATALDIVAPALELAAAKSANAEALLQRLREIVRKDVTVPVTVLRNWLEQEE